MMFVWAAFSLYSIQWIFLPFVENQWEFLFGFQLMMIAFLVSGIANLFSNEKIILRYTVILFAIMAWADYGKYILWTYSDKSIDTSVPIAIVFAVWIIHLQRRKYDRPNDQITTNTVMLLIKKPDGVSEMLKSILGYPTSSLCFYADGRVWSFRKRTNRFESFFLTQSFLEDHVAIDTGHPVNADVINGLENLIGTSRGIACKCVWTVRRQLNLLGGKFSIKTWLDYIPSLYIARIL